jgi:hypothetical protein
MASDWLLKVVLLIYKNNILALKVNLTFRKAALIPFPVPIVFAPVTVVFSSGQSSTTALFINY